MIKNEERYIQQTLRSVLPYAEHAIIVDTGSTDNTTFLVEKILAESPTKNWTFIKDEVVGDSINWDGNHLSQTLTNIRNNMLENTTTDWVWQVDGDEIYTEDAVHDLRLGMSSLEFGQGVKGIMVPIRWCSSDEEFYPAGPFPKTLRVMPSSGRWVGEFPNEFLYVDGVPIHMNDPRCISTNHPFLHMSMALHPERRPSNELPVELSEEEKKCLNS